MNKTLFCQTCDSKFFKFNIEKFIKTSRWIIEGS